MFYFKFKSLLLIVLLIFSLVLTDQVKGQTANEIIQQIFDPSFYQDPEKFANSGYIEGVQKQIRGFLQKETDPATRQLLETALTALDQALAELKNLPKVPSIPVELPKLPPPEPEIPTTPEASPKPVIEPTPSLEKQEPAGVSQIIQQLRSDPKVVQIIKEVAVPVSLAVGAVGAGAITVTATAGSATVGMNLGELFQIIRFLRFYVLGLIRFRRKNPWGRVEDKLSGRPVPSAVVRIFQSEFKKLKDTQITDQEGRFGAVVGPGNYFLNVSKRGFENLETKPVQIDSSNQILNLELHLSPAQNFNLAYLKRINLLNFLKHLLELLNPYLLILGTAISLIVAVIVPNGFNYATLGVYALLDFLKIYFKFRLLRSFGVVKDSYTEKPVPLAVVRIFDEEKQWLLSTKATDEEGRFNFLLASGKYYLTCSKADYSAYRSDTLIFKKAGLASLDIKLMRV